MIADPKESPNFCAELRVILDHLLPEVETVEIQYGGNDPERTRFIDSIVLKLRQKGGAG